MYAQSQTYLTDVACALWELSPVWQSDTSTHPPTPGTVRCSVIVVVRGWGLDAVAGRGWGEGRGLHTAIVATGRGVTADTVTGKTHLHLQLGGRERVRLILGCALGLLF